MPIHEYECRKCTCSFEYFHRSSADEAVPTCPSCGGSHVERKLSVFSAPQGTPKPCQAPMAGPCHGCCDATKACHM